MDAPVDRTTTTRPSTAPADWGTLRVKSWLAAAIRKPMGKVAISVMTIVAASSIGIAIYSNRPVAVRVASLESNVPVRVFGLGTVEARVISKVGFEVGATLVELNADHGDLVKSGDVLARLHAAEQEAKVARAKATVLNAEAAGRKAQANVEKTRAVLAQKQESNRRKQALVGRNIVSEQTAEEAQRDEDVARADLSVALSEVEVAKAQLADARALLDYEKIILEHHTLTAPFDAVVVERSKESGTVIKAGDPIFTLVAPDSIWALAYIDESRAGAISEGQRVEVRLRSLPQQVFDARVVRIGIEGDRVSEERRVYVKCVQCPPRFHLGEQVEVLITVATLDSALSHATISWRLPRRSSASRCIRRRWDGSYESWTCRGRRRDPHIR